MSKWVKSLEEKELAHLIYIKQDFKNLVNVNNVGWLICF